MMNLTFTEAQELLKVLRKHLPFGEVLDNDILWSAINKLKVVPKLIVPAYEVRDGNKVTAIKMYRLATGAGLRESKDVIDARMYPKNPGPPATYEYIQLPIFLPEMTPERFEEIKKLVRADTHLCANVRWLNI